MPRLVNILPAYRRHKASGKAVVTLSGVDHYLGTFDTPESRKEYDRLIAEWLANGRRVSQPTQPVAANASKISDINRPPAVTACAAPKKEMDSYTPTP